MYIKKHIDIHWYSEFCTTSKLYSQYVQETVSVSSPQGPAGGVRDLPPVPVDRALPGRRQLLGVARGLARGLGVDARRRTLGPREVGVEGGVRLLKPRNPQPFQ